MAETKVVVITGTRKGIGRALVEHYAGRGCHVVGCSRSRFEGELPNYRHYCLDVGDEPAVKRMFSEIRKHHGRLDVLINNTGLGSMNQSLLTPISAATQIIGRNFTRTVLFFRAAARLMHLP